MKSILALALLMAASHGHANQTVNKCIVNGTTSFSDTPCVKSQPGRALALNESIAAAPKSNSQSHVGRGREACKSGLADILIASSEKSQTLGHVSGGRFDSAIDFGEDGTAAGRSYFLPVKTINGHGGYGGERAYVCITSVDGSRVIKIAARGGE